jgi:hypothetical protein
MFLHFTNFTLKSTSTAIIIIIVLLLLSFGCGSIKPYSLTDIHPDTQQVVVIMPASDYLKDYDSSLAVQWERTFNFCYQIKRAMVMEIDQREKQISSQRRWLLGIGALAGLANSLYAGTRENPEKEVVVPLSLISGSALLTALPSFSDDERLTTLNEKLDELRIKEQLAVDNFYLVERKVAELANENYKLSDANPSFVYLTDEKEKRKIVDNVNQYHLEFIEVAERLRQALVDWSNAAQ